MCNPVTYGSNIYSPRSSIRFAFAYETLCFRFLVILLSPLSHNSEVHAYQSEVYHHYEDHHHCCYRYFSSYYYYHDYSRDFKIDLKHELQRYHINKDLLSFLHSSVLMLNKTLYVITLNLEFMFSISYSFNQS